MGRVYIDALLPKGLINFITSCYTKDLERQDCSPLNLGSDFEVVYCTSEVFLKMVKEKSYSSKGYYFIFYEKVSDTLGENFSAKNNCLFFDSNLPLEN